MINFYLINDFNNFFNLGILIFWFKLSSLFLKCDLIILHSPLLTLPWLCIVSVWKIINVPALPSIGFKLSIMGFGNSLDFLKYLELLYEGLGRGKVLCTQCCVDADMNRYYPWSTIMLIPIWTDSTLDQQ